MATHVTLKDENLYIKDGELRYGPAEKDPLRLGWWIEQAVGTGGTRVGFRRLPGCKIDLEGVDLIAILPLWHRALELKKERGQFQDDLCEAEDKLELERKRLELTRKCMTWKGNKQQSDMIECQHLLLERAKPILAAYCTNYHEDGIEQLRIDIDAILGDVPSPGVEVQYDEDYTEDYQEPLSDRLKRMEHRLAGLETFSFVHDYARHVSDDTEAQRRGSDD